MLAAAGVGVNLPMTVQAVTHEPRPQPTLDSAYDLWTSRLPAAQL